jgi:hypothetical protein
MSHIGQDTQRERPMGSPRAGQRQAQQMPRVSTQLRTQAAFTFLRRAGRAHSKKLVPLGLISSLDWQAPEGIGIGKTAYASVNGVVQPVAREG